MRQVLYLGNLLKIEHDCFVKNSVVASCYFGQHFVPIGGTKAKNTTKISDVKERVKVVKFRYRQTY